MNFFMRANYRGGQGYSLDTGFDVLNLQSNNAANFTTVAGKISQWNDLSGSGRHAVQTTDANRPTLVGLNPTFDGSLSRLNLASAFSSNTYSLYLVVKNNDTSTVKVVVGGGTNRYVGGTNQFFTINNTGETGGITGNYTCWGAEYYQVISVRSNPLGTVIKCNGRKLYLSTGSSVTSVVQAMSIIGNYSPFTTGNTYNWNGIIKAVCVHSEYQTDAQDTAILNALFTRYALPEISNAIVGFGDSITLGTGATTPATGGWLPLLATAKSRARKNYGIGSSRLTTLNSNSGIARYNIQVTERPYSDTIIMLFGANDIGSVTSAEFKSALQTVVSGFLDAGYSASNIYIGSPTYQIGDGHAVEIADFSTKISEVCTEFGLPAIVDIYNPMKNGGGDTLLADSIHPNDSGHAVIRDAFAARIA